MAIRMLDQGVDRASDQPFFRLRLRHLLARALAQASELSRAAPLLAAVADEYRRYGSTPKAVLLDLAYQAGYAYAELGRASQALPHLSYYLHNADDDADHLLDIRFLKAQMLAADGERDDAVAELDAVRPLLVDEFGERSTQVRNLDRVLVRLQS